jgi:inorganic pyrophosphatase
MEGRLRAYINQRAAVIRQLARFFSYSFEHSLLRNMKFKKIPPSKKGIVNVIIETPRGSQNKFAYDPDVKCFKLNKTLPMGTVFPFDFGCIPNTKGEDGDPLDILVIMEEPAYPGILVECRLVGVLEANQTEEDGSTTRNDRYVGVSECSVLYADIENVHQLNKNMVKEIENFFKEYNKHAGKKFTPIGWKGGEEAFKSIDKKGDKD